MTIMHVMNIYLYSDSEETSLYGHKSESRKFFLSCRKFLVELLSEDPLQKNQP